MVFCRMPASKEYILNCSARSSFGISCLSFLGIRAQRKNFFKLTSALIFALGKPRNKNFTHTSANTIQNGNPDSNFTLKGPVTSVKIIYGFSSAWVLANLDTWVFVILANAHTLHTSSSYPTVCGAFLTTSFLIDMTQSSVPFPCIVQCHAVGAHLEH